jgi:hypothetical protein
MRARWVNACSERSLSTGGQETTYVRRSPE